MKIRCFDIKWDQDDDDDTELPQEVFLEVEPDSTDEDEFEDAISDALSDKIGYCHGGFEFELVS